MTSTIHIGIIGEVCIDVPLNNGISKKDKLRLGGVVHSCRACWALNIPFSLFYISPEYLTELVEDYLTHHDVSNLVNIGYTKNSPAVMLINDVQESGTQGYSYLLNEELIIKLDSEKISFPEKYSAITDFLIFPRDYDLKEILDFCKKTNARVHIDIANFENDLTILNHLNRQIQTVFSSTSSQYFLNNCNKNTKYLKENLDKSIGFNELIIKENRGGSVIYFGNKTKRIDAQLGKTVHSVGVGDVYAATYIYHRFQNSQDPVIAGTYASWIASEYAKTTFMDNFKTSVQNIELIPPKEISEIDGVCLPWDKRNEINIYIAAPDFDYVDTSQIELAVNCLEYHNFTVKRPIKENGQVSKETNRIDRQIIFTNDLKLIYACQLIFAIPTYADPGTLVEIGYAKGLGKPVVVFNPNNIDNLFFNELPNLVTNDIEEAITQVFILLGRKP
jgi:nucleoside 2-deoxyribosyltransferase/sugar/nucleoside kinase (ribokinase family)